MSACLCVPAYLCRYIIVLGLVALPDDALRFLGFVALAIVKMVTEKGAGLV